MEKSLFEQFGGTYTMQGDYCLPNLHLPIEEDRPIGVWGQRRRTYLKEHHRVLYYNLLTSGKLNDHLEDVEERANKMFLQLVEQMAKREGITDQLKSENQMKWVTGMNNIRSRATEIVDSSLIYA